MCPCVKCTVCVKPRRTNEGVFFILHLAVRGTIVESSLRKVTVWIIVLHGNRNRTKSCKKKQTFALRNTPPCLKNKSILKGHPYQFCLASSKLEHLTYWCGASGLNRMQSDSGHGLKAICTNCRNYTQFPVLEVEIEMRKSRLTQ